MTIQVRRTIEIEFTGEKEAVDVATLAVAKAMSGHPVHSRMSYDMDFLDDNGNAVDPVELARVRKRAG